MVVSGDLTSATADVSQDLGIPPATAYYVSVAAVDAAGHESLYAICRNRCDSTNTCSQPADALKVTAIATPTPTPTATPTPTPTATPTPTPTPSGPALSGLTYNGGAAFVNGTNLIAGTSYTITAQANANTRSVVFAIDGGICQEYKFHGSIYFQLEANHSRKPHI